MKLLCTMALFVVISPLFAQNPRSSGQSRQSRQSGKTAQPAIPLVTMRGTLKLINKKEITIETGDEQTITFRRSKKTTFLKETKEIPERQFQPGSAIAVEASREPTG